MSDHTHVVQNGVEQSIVSGKCRTTIGRHTGRIARVANICQREMPDSIMLMSSPEESPTRRIKTIMTATWDNHGHMENEPEHNDNREYPLGQFHKNDAQSITGWVLCKIKFHA